MQCRAKNAATRHICMQTGHQGSQDCHIPSLAKLSEASPSELISSSSQLRSHSFSSGISLCPCTYSPASQLGFQLTVAVPTSCQFLPGGGHLLPGCLCLPKQAGCFSPVGQACTLCICCPLALSLSSCLAKQAFHTQWQYPHLSLR